MKEKIIKIRHLLNEVDDNLVREFFDIESENLLDEKIQVLTDLKNGKKPNEIPDYYKVLELYPKDGVLWD